MLMKVIFGNYFSMSYEVLLSPSVCASLVDGPSKQSTPLLATILGSCRSIKREVDKNV